MEEKLKENIYFEKYKPKLESLKNNDPIEYLRRLDKLAQTLQVVKDANKKQKEEPEQKTQDATIEKSMSGKDKAPTGLPFDLSKLMKLELIQDKSAEEIGSIWKQYFAQENSICAVIKKRKYTQLSTLALVCPQFIYPVPRDEGYEIYLGEWRDNMLFFTSLVQYKAHQENAPVAVAMHHYTNLQDSHGMVLMAAKVNTDQISVQDAQFLAYCVELFYGTDDGELVRMFRYKPDQFKYEMVIERIEKLVQNSLPRAKNPPQSKGTRKSND